MNDGQAKVYHEPQNYYEILNHDPMQNSLKIQQSNNAAQPFLKQFKINSMVEG